METCKRKKIVFSSAKSSQEGTTLWKRWKLVASQFQQSRVAFCVRKELLSERDGNPNKSTPPQFHIHSVRKELLSERDGNEAYASSSLTSQMPSQEGTTLWKRWKLSVIFVLLVSVVYVPSGRNYSLKEMETYNYLSNRFKCKRYTSGRNYSLKEMETCLSYV